MGGFFKEVMYRDEPGFAGELKRDLIDYKVVVLKGIDPTIDLDAFYTDLTDKLGEIVDADEDNTTGNRQKARWTDIRYDKEQENTFRHSATQQPLHTDTAYTSYDNDVNFFFCRVQAEVGGATTFIDGEALWALLEKYRPELLEKLLNNTVIFDKGVTERKEKPIISKDDKGVVLNWNYFRVSDDNSDEVKQMCEDFHEFLERKVVDAGILTGATLSPGEAVFFQDTRILHGRNAFFGQRTLIKGALNFVTETA
jgi:alpha-ketoglutarate-dependent taurine dioxygenase